MSDYPPNPSYGLNYGAQDPANPPYLPPTYPAQYLQPDDGRMAHTNLASNYDAYGYNNAVPAFNPTPMGSAVPPVPIYQGWNQDPAPLAPYNPHSGPQYPGYPDNAHHNSPYYPQPQAVYQPPPHAARHYDEGEVSEGEFEVNAGRMNNAPAAYGASQFRSNDSPAYVEPSQRPSYPRPQAQATQQPYRAVANHNVPTRDSPRARQLSDAYSPHVSPVAVDSRDQGNTNHSYNSHTPLPTTVATNGGLQGQNGQTQSGVSGSSDARSRPNSRVAPISTEDPIVPASHVHTPPALGEASNVTPKTLADARKKAQGAILNLWPYDVRFQTYVEEGFEEDLVGGLFDDLRMPRGSAKPLAKDGEIIPHRAAVPSPSNGAAKTTTASQSLDRHSGLNGRSPPLPIQISGTHAIINCTTPTKAAIPVSVNAANTVAKPSAAMTEKERTLQSKMEALRKSREERAQKAAAKNTAKSPTDVTPNIQPQPQSTAPVLSTTQAHTPSTLALSTVPRHISPIEHPTPDPSVSTEPVKQNNQPQAPAIPGLFLASTAPRAGSPSNAPSMATTTTLINQRKRPVAADFDPLPSTISQFKRPFGHSGHDRRLVIDVSDEEADSDDEDVEMDLESQADQDSPMQPPRKMSDQRAAAIHNLQPLSDFPSRKPFTPPPNSSAASTPPTSKAALGRPEVLQRKESQIEQLKKRIAEAEARRKARQTPSGTQTPRAGDNQNAETVDDTGGNASLTSKVEASMKMQQLIGIADKKVNSDQQKLLETQAAELEKTAELKQNEDESKRLRLEKIALDLPLIDVQVQQTQTKLQQLRSEAAKLEAEIFRNMEIKQQMAEEMERLGQETEQRLQAEKEKLQYLTKAETGNNGTNGDSFIPPSSTITEAGIINSPLPVGGLDQTSPSVSNESQPLEAASIQDLDPNSQQNPARSVEDSEAKLMGATGTTQQLLLDPHDQTSADHALEAALQEAVRAEADSHAHNDLEMEDSFAPDPNQLAPESSPSLADEGSQSPVYSPVLERSVPDVLEADGESDNYEPPEATPPVDAPSPVDSPPFSPAPPDMVIEPTSVEESMQLIDDTSREPASDMPLHQNGSAPRNDVKSGPEKPRFFTPYESPLKHFGAFRFHPTYKQEVPGGLRSLTYSHKIDPDVEFCRYELAGGICNDTTCEFQHFRDIGLPDDAVLTNLGSPEQFSPSQREKFCEGLRAVLTGLRARKIKDFEVIASEIVAHRSKFLGDNSKVLNLEGTGI
ncbi:uncharacterized protein BP5553_01482 [Venustampulla echinocandica]|uniref:Putative zinc-finger domain-containing protein n=1 Tax=Venustampulla echinocandica TaxID=2656787 RepID=A0A370U179_9HELO|nr:uncharacterized protein BP5553_01482 [Venustampulla echinocandica]RDL41503.1 hypothetical protein BP5553_01482 [Venustampulla echinocandica]